MQNFILRSAAKTLAALTVTLTLGVSLAHAGNMQEALDSLERAKYSEKDWHVDRALDRLESAKHHLEESGSNSPARTEAIHEVREAIGAAKDKAWRSLNVHTDRAIHLIRESLMEKPKVVVAPVKTHGSNMKEALAFLESAKHNEKDWHADRALERLEGAKRHLEESGSEAPERREALHQVREAIEALRDKSWRSLNEHTDRAIHLIRETL